jgi:hypothetical protein
MLFCLPRRFGLGGRLLERQRLRPFHARARRQWRHAEREEYRRRSKALDLQRHRREGYYQTRAWKPEDLLLLGRRSDGRVAKKTGRTLEAVRQKRQELGIRNPRAREWQPEELRLLDKFSDGAVAARTGRTVWAVYQKRWELRRARRWR